GRGGSIGRGGGPARHAVEGPPPRAVYGRFKPTEQGEEVGWQYLFPEVAERKLQLVLVGILAGSSRAPRSPGGEELAGYEEAFAPVASSSFEAYRALVGSPQFLAYFEEATPIAEISALPIGSRPARRQGTRSLDDLRAIPWGFAWTQSRAM